MADDTSEKKSWRTGCGYVFVSLVFFAVVAGFLALRPVREAKQIEQNLTDRFGEVPSFSPAAHGTVTPERIETFIAVRESLRETCARMQENRNRFDNLARMEEKGEVSSDDIVDGFKTAFSFGPDFFHLMRSRNDALLAKCMGLGEYSYIYVLAYRDQLKGLVAGQDNKNIIKPRTRMELTQILRNQLASLNSGDAAEEAREMILSVQEEINALENGTHAIPWEDGLPPVIEDSLVPFREQLDELFLEASARFELRQKNKRPGGIGD